MSGRRKLQRGCLGHGHFPAIGSLCSEPAGGGRPRCRTRDLLHIINARHGAQSQAMLGALPQVSKPTADELAAPDAPQGQEWSAVKSSNYMRDLVELWGFEPQTSCMPCTLRPPLGVAWRGPAWRPPAPSVAGCRLASLHVGSPLGSQNSLAPLIFDDPYGKPTAAAPRAGGCRTPGPTLARMPPGVKHSGNGVPWPGVPLDRSAAVLRYAVRAPARGGRQHHGNSGT